MRYRDRAYPIALAAVACVAALATALPVRAEWSPDGIVRTTASLADVLAANARASGRNDPTLRRRRERWVYAAGGMRADVGVAVRDDDYRTSTDFAARTYVAGRLSGTRWRADANGVAHDVSQAEIGDALDRAPQSSFAIDPASCTLAGEARLPRPAWVLRTARNDEPPAYLYVDESTGAIVRETWRESARTVTVMLDSFRPLGSGSRAYHWTVDDGIAADHIDATLASVDPGDVAPADLRRPARATFAAADRTLEVPATFVGGYVIVPVAAAGRRLRFILDTNDPGILVTPGLARLLDGSAMQRVTLPSFVAGPLSIDAASAAIGPTLGPYDGLLGSSFFLGHVVDIDFVHQRLRVLSAQDGVRAFADARVATVAADATHGILTAPAAFGSAIGDAFMIDVTSPGLILSKAFAERHAAVVATWTRTSPARLAGSFVGSAELESYRAPMVTFANASARDQTVLVQVASTRRDDVTLAFDGSIGNAFLRNFDVLIDYDGGRIGLRPAI